MKSLTVIYDNDCGLCCRAARRLIPEPAYLPLRFAPGRAPQVRERFASAFAVAGDDQLIVLADTGEVYKGPSAWIMVLYALRRYRPLAMRLASPTFRPLAARVIAIIAHNRVALSEFFGLSPDVCILTEARAAGAAPPTGTGATDCPNGACERSEHSITRLDRLIKARQSLRTTFNAHPAPTPPPLPTA